MEEEERPRGRRRRRTGTPPRRPLVRGLGPCRRTYLGPAPTESEIQEALDRAGFRRNLVSC